MAVLYNDEMMKQILEIAHVVEREGVANFICSDAARHHSGHFCGIDVSSINGKVCYLKTCDLEIELKPVSLANDNPQQAAGAMAIHFLAGSPSVLTQWHQTITSFGFQISM